MSKPSKTPFKLDISPEGLVETITDCLNFSNVFNITGFETINDKLLLEMNERAKQVRLEEEKRNNTRLLPALDTSLGAYAKMTRSPPDKTRFSAAHRKVFASSPSINALPVFKRSGSGEESPSKRLKSQGGVPIGLASPTKPLKNLSLSNDEKLEKISVARQRDKQLRDLQMSPRRRLPQIPTSKQSRKPFHESSKIPKTQLEERAHRHVSNDGSLAKSQHPKAPFLKPLPGPYLQKSASSRSLSQSNPFSAVSILPPQIRAPSSSVSHSKVSTKHSITSSPRSRLTRDFATVRSANRNATGLLSPNDKHTSASAEIVNIPSYARPTQAAMRRSQSVNQALNMRPHSRT